METIAYGLFANRLTADAAIEKLEPQGYSEEVHVAEYVGEIEDEDVPGLGTRSRSYALIGGLIAAVVGGALGAIFADELLGAGRVTTAVVGALGAGVLAAFLGSLAGAAVPRSEVEALNRQVEAGKILITVDVPYESTADELRTKLAELGALQTGLLAGVGIKSMLRVRPDSK